ncbi:hypothetical protein N643_09980 [Salmonella bongori serovar 48:z41:-- str. RKS3044]|nr:hypothetical protein N643_09980 [Salmonella bongori serovar 48:z41:-- str. RKS3044]
MVGEIEQVVEKWHKKRLPVVEAVIVPQFEERSTDP